MNELTNTLFEFVMRHNTVGIWNDLEYEKLRSLVETRKERLNNQLDERQRKLLAELLEELELTHCLEREYMFQATLALSRELSRLVQA